VSFAVNKALLEAKAPSHMGVTTVRKNQAGNIILTLNPATTTEELTAHLETIQRAAQTVHPSLDNPHINERWYKLAVHGIPTDIYPDTEEGMRLLREEIERSNNPVTLAQNPRYMTTAEKRAGKTASSVVIAVRTPDELALLKRRKVLVLFEARRVTEYFTARKTDQCRRCQLYGHHHATCTGPPGPICALCGKEHPTENHNCTECPTRNGKSCSHTKYECRNCVEAGIPEHDHPAFHKQCPTRLRIHKEAREATQPAASTSPNPTDKDTDMIQHV
jgi:hypothetical protein